MDTNKWKKIHIVIEIAVAAAILFLMIFPVQGNEYRRYADENMEYMRGTVEEILEEELYESTLKTGQQLGLQKVRVELSDGERVKIDNYLTETHNIFVKEGQTIIVCADRPENAEPYYTVFNYDRIPGLLCLITVFLLLLLITGGRKGMDSALAVFFTLTFILRAALPAVYNGFSPAAAGFLTVLLSTLVTLVLLQGISFQCGLSITVTLLGEGGACLLFAVFSNLLHLTGFQTNDAEALLLIAQNTGLQVKTLLFAGAMIASLGAVMDVAVSIISALKEVSAVSECHSGRELFRSGMNIGRDMIGTMSNTLIFAFTGSALTTMLVFYSYGVHFNQLLNSDYLAVEVAQGLCSTAAVILTVPAAAFVGAAAYSRHKKRAAD